MAAQTNLLFNAKTITRLCQDVKITPKQRQAAKEWLQLLLDNKLEDEKSNYPKFMQIILQDILGYPIKEINYEKGNVEFQFANSEGRNVLCFEAKGTSTSDLFAPQHRAKKEHETPIKQTWDYMGSIGLDYGICTNYKDFVLITKQFGYSKYHVFDFNSIKRNEEKLKEFVGIFSKERLIDKGFVEKLHKESIIEEREFTKEFYKLFHETRLMMIKSFQENPEVTKEEAIHYTQMYLNRLIFMFFAEDHDFLEDKLFTKRITEVLNSPLISEHSKMISDEILGLFQAMDKGSHRLGIFGFNGGLFQDQIPSKIYFSDLKDAKFFKDVRQNSKLKIKPNEETQKIINKYQNELNPIIINLLMMDSFDFTTEVNVNILGHIFEQSISDLEELRGVGVSRRKKEGVYYTPEYITDYICRNTIVPYLSKSGTNSIPELINEYKDDIEELENKFKEIKILDPACGSGAFLVKAVDILLEIHKEIQIIKESRGKYATGSQFQLTKWNEEAEARIFVENNIYGVDINEESVEITKLSLFLKIASKHRKLSTLKNIKVGNSLIEDKTVDPRAFDWKKEFPEVMDVRFGGFDVVIGNPPYVQSRDQRVSEPMKVAIEKRFPTAYSMWDLYVPFMELGTRLLKLNGVFGMIVKDTLGEVDYTSKLVEHIENNYDLYQIDFFPEIDLFDDASVRNKIVFIRKKQSEKPTLRILHHPRMYNITKLENTTGVKKYIHKTAQVIIDTKDTLSLGEICFTSYGLRLNSDKNDKQFKFKKDDLISEEKSDINNRVYTEGKYLEKYAITKELFVEWGTERCPKRLVRPTFQELYEPKKILMSRQKRIAAFSDRKHICDNTIIVGVLAKDLKHVNNSNIRKYYTNLKTPRETIEKNSEMFNLKYILAVLNSDLISYFLKYNSGGKIDSYPDDWKKIPIKVISLTEQEKFIENANLLIDLNTNFHHTKQRFLNRIQTEYKIKSLKSLERFYELSSNEFLLIIQELNTLTLLKKDELEEYFEHWKDTILEIEEKIKKVSDEVNEMIFALYGIKENEKIIIKNELYVE